MSFELAIQSIIYQTLTSHAPLLDIVTGVFDDVPEFQEFPYVTVGESTHSENDTVAVFGDDSTITVHVWSRYDGKRETKVIQGAIYDALHRAKPAYTGYNVMGIDWVSSQSFVDSDGLTRHGVQLFRILIDKL